MAGHEGDHREPAAERKRADIAHEDMCGVRVVPEEAERSSCNREAKGAKECLFLKKRDCAVRSEGDCGGARDQPVEAIGDGDAASRYHDDAERDRYVQPTNVVRSLVRDVDVPQFYEIVERVGCGGADRNECQELDTLVERPLLAAPQRTEVIDPTEEGECTHHHERQAN